MDWNEIAEAYLGVGGFVLTELRPAIEALAAELVSRLRQGHKILVCGNGGSAADAQHMAGEMVNRFLKERRPFACVALSTDTSVLTSIANDYGYEQTFEKQVRALGQPGDVLIAISTSGHAQNVLRAVDAARATGLLTVALTGGDGGDLARRADRVLCVSCSGSVPRIQEGHQLIIHLLCEAVEQELAS